MKTLVLAEKPSVGKDLAKVLSCHKKSKSYIEGASYIVTWAMGHLVELADPSVYNEAWKTWSLDVLPMLPDTMRHKVIGKTRHQFQTIKQLLHRSDVNNVVIATDAGREGELVARWILRLAAYKGPLQRLWISSQTEKAIKDGFSRLKDASQYYPLFLAAEARAEADWIIGLNITRALCCHYDARLSAGRVQTPTLAIIARREKDIANFQAKPYWLVDLDLGQLDMTWLDDKKNTRILSFDTANDIVKSLEGAKAHITDIIRKNKQQAPPLLFDLTALQREANALHGFSAKQTLTILQGLYERHKIVSYPRTDSRYLSSDLLDTLAERLEALKHTQYAKLVKEIQGKPITASKRFINDAKVTDHHALIPTEERPVLERLSADEKKIYTMILKRFLAVLSDDAEYEVITVLAEAAGHRLQAHGTRLLKQGWKKTGDLHNEGLTEDPAFINVQGLQNGSELLVEKVKVRQQMTKAPARYTEGLLLAVMENPSRFIRDKVLRDSIQKGGLGTPATRADIIEKLFANYYIERKGKELLLTEQGRSLLQLVPDELKSPELTAKWELRLSRIAENQERPEQFLKDIRKKAQEYINAVMGSSGKYEPKNLVNTPCPLCGRKLMKAKDKKGFDILVCQSRSCGYEEESSSHNQNSARPGRREKAISRQMMHKYEADQKEETFTLADMLKQKHK